MPIHSIGVTCPLGHPGKEQEVAVFQKNKQIRVGIPLADRGNIEWVICILAEGVNVVRVHPVG